jgi:hypothetical protein
MKKQEIIKADEEFMELCRKYPERTFLGNGLINVYLLKKNARIFKETDLKNSLFGKECFFCYNNSFEGKTKF